MAIEQLTISAAYYTGTDTDGQATMPTASADLFDGVSSGYVNLGPGQTAASLGCDLGSAILVSRIETSADNNAWSNFKILYNTTNGASGWTEVTNLTNDKYNEAGTGVDGKYLQQWNFDAVSAQWWKIWGNHGSSTGVQSVYELEIFGFPFTGSFAGFVYEHGSPVVRTLYLYNRSDGSYIDTTTSSGDGSYSFTTSYSGAHFVVCLDDEAGEDFNDLIFGNVFPITVSG